MESTPITVAALYRFADWPQYEAQRQPLLDLCLEGEVRGTLLLAREGINGTIAGPDSGVRAVVEAIQREPGFESLELKYSQCDAQPFLRTKVRLKQEIVTIGDPEVNPNEVVGEYVEPEDWNALISDPDTLVVDTRNDYEIEVGAFERALDPNTKSFREFPDYVDAELSAHRDRKIAMYCTGGIRCEKATALLRQRGFDKVYHLKGGVLNYFAKVPEEQSLWRGDLFVFDNRVAVNHDIEPSGYDLCHACRFPLSPEDLQSPDYRPGVHCPRCVHTQTERNRARAEAREKQMRLAKARNTPHIGAEAAALKSSQ